MTALQALGIDVGSTTMKIVGVGERGEMVWHLLEETEPWVEEQIGRFLAQAEQVNGPLDGVPLVATGYGRGLAKRAARQVTEITCHARGVFEELGHGGTLVDIGGQDSKVVRISQEGRVLDFAMNDKCAAGTGRFLENTARRLKVPLEQMGHRALSVSEDVPISSTCTVFAESEVVSLLARGTPVASIVRGLHRSLVTRIVALIQGVGLEPPLMLSGGVVQNPAIRALLEEVTGEQAIVPERPQLSGAYGAALVALGMN